MLGWDSIWLLCGQGATSALQDTTPGRPFSHVISEVFFLSLLRVIYYFIQWCYKSNVTFNLFPFLPLNFISCRGHKNILLRMIGNFILMQYHQIPFKNWFTWFPIYPNKVQCCYIACCNSFNNALSRNNTQEMNWKECKVSYAFLQ